MNDFILFGALPYVVMAVFLIVTIQRYRMKAFSYSSLSSQFLENQQHFWGSVPFHYGILVVILGHILAFLMPKAILSWNAEALRLMLLEVTGIAFAVLTLVGLINIMLRRCTRGLVRKVTTRGDWVVYVMLLVQVMSGIGISIFHGWGSSWFATNLTPWLWSIVRLSPDVTYVAPLPILVKVHIVNAFLLIGFFPFTRLVHILVVPNPYLWRRTQVVIWNWDRSQLRKGD